MERAAVAGLVLGALTALQAGAAPPRAVTADPPRAGPGAVAPASAEVRLDSHGARLNGFLYLAGGAGPHPVVLLLHGFPGNERNLDVAQVLRRAGNDVLYFDYRGSWGSAGTFTFAGGIDDVEAALRWVRDPAQVAQYHLDPTRIRIVGHSYGGWLALNAAAVDADVRCVATLAAWNAGYAASRFEDHPDEAAARLASYRSYVDGEGAPIHAEAEELMRELRSHAAAYDTAGLATALAGKRLLLIGASRDSPWSGYDQQERVARALRAAGGRTVRLMRFEDDHSFNASRIALSAALVEWLARDCAAGGS